MVAGQYGGDCPSIARQPSRLLASRLTSSYSQGSICAVALAQKMLYSCKMYTYIAKHALPWLPAGPDNLRRYEIAEVRRKGLQTGRSLPRGYLQADLDIVHPPGLPPADKLLAEAELIKASAQLCLPCCAWFEGCQRLPKITCRLQLILQVLTLLTSCSLRLSSSRHMHYQSHAVHATP